MDHINQADYEAPFNGIEVIPAIRNDATRRLKDLEGKTAEVEILLHRMRQEMQALKAVLEALTVNQIQPMPDPGPWDPPMMNLAPKRGY